MAGLVVSLVHEVLDHLILLDQLRVLGIQGRVKVRVWRALQLVHELQDCLLLVLEEPLDPLADVLHAALQRQVRLVAEQLHHDVPPSERAHGDAAGLDDIPLLGLACNLGEPQEDLHLVHEPPELCAAVDLHVEGRYLDLIPEVLDVVVEAAEVLRREHAEVGRAKGLVVLVELTQLLLKIHDRPEVENALHDVRQCRGEGDAAVPRGAEYPVGVGLVELRLQLRHLLLPGALQVLEVCHDRAQCVDKHLLDLLLHVDSEALEPNGLHVLGAQPPRLHLPEVLGVHVLLQLVEVLRGWRPVPPPGQRQGEADQGLGQVAKPIDPLVHVVCGEIVVVLVELVADEDRPLKVRVDLSTPLQRGHGRRVCGLLDTEHHVPPVPHEALHELYNLLGQDQLGGVQREVAEARQVDDLHVNASG
mmetsp:Transcript_30335/g.68929  ORF Transcript_30335/g.68929 Transcript_30335/m.68929 type:complete len:418 (-) Transcript_30335:495-1748(-)